MRFGLTIPLAIFATFAAPAGATQLVMPEAKPVFYSAYDRPEIAQPWQSRRPDLLVTERPVGELIAVKLGLADGQAELFSYRLENAPSDKTMLDGVIDGGGVRLKLSW